jgi:hypothetical protein
MGANTRYYVQVVKPTYEWVEVSAVTELEAVEIASNLPDVIKIKSVKHWSYFEEGDGC